MYLIPAPSKLTHTEGSFLLSYDSFICAAPCCSQKVFSQISLFEKSLSKTLGFSLMQTCGTANPGDICIISDKSSDDNAQNYTLDICPDRITLKGSEKGVWYGMQTLLQIAEQCGALLPCLHIEDQPDIPNRAYYFDCTRGRIPKLDWLKQLADRMAYYKMNQLQLYIEHTYLWRGMTELWRDDTPLTPSEIMEFDRYCLERGIELVPSFSSFGHLYKLLSAKSWSHLCELEDSDKQPFSVKGRMNHHTIDTTNPEGIELIKSMITEYMQLFTSRQFNLCADETFDLGTGKSKEAAKRLGKDRLYINYVRELADFLIQNGRRPMFWGDIILNFPHLFSELPKETICLNWGYAPNQTEENTKKLADVGAAQYCCPGCCAWNQLVPLFFNSYQNIMRQCAYAKKYGAIGILNTDWGDYLHINHPDFSRIGMIYGAAFSWNTKIPSFEDINHQISRLEYLDSSENLVSILAKIPDCNAFQWEFACMYRERKMGLDDFVPLENWLTGWLLPFMDHADEDNEKLLQIKKELSSQISSLNKETRSLIRPYLVAVDGMLLFNELGKAVTVADYQKTYKTMPDYWKLSSQLEAWLYHYKEVYRTISRESELKRIEEIVCWYADFLRTAK